MARPSLHAFVAAAWLLAAGAPGVARGGGRAQALAVDPGERLVAVAAGPDVVLWDRQGLAQVRVLPVEGAARAVAFQDDGTLVAVVRREGGGSVLLRPGAEPSRALRLGDGPHCAVAPDGSAAACASDSEATVVAPRAPRREASVRWPEAPTAAVAISPGGRLLAIASPAGRVRVFAAFGAALATLEPGARAVALAFSRDGALLAVGGDDGVVRVWPTSALRGAPRLVGALAPGEGARDPGRAATALAFGPGDRLASANGVEARVFGHGSARPTAVPVGRGAVIGLVRGELLAMGPDGSLRAFDAATGAERLPPRAPPRR